ncbi:MAG TPA: tripartite tricarboxylate transporter TctB family protein [Usitatibacter sp.]|nr:tripartite tricarboxylate transporter TctB family protein [Usitatibacter sp.]
MKIGHQKNFWGGILFVVIGGMFALIAKGLKFGDTVLLAGYAMGTPARMGPGFFPFYLGMLLVLLGLIIASTGLKAHPNDPGKVDRFHWKPILYVLISVVMFGILLKTIGMLLAGIMLVVGASLGSAEFNLRRSIILALILVVFCAFVFVGGLKLPIPLCPDIESLQNAIKVCRS